MSCHQLPLHVATGPLAVAAGQNEEVEEPWATYLHLWQAILLPDMPDKPTVSSRSSRGPRLGLFKEDDDPEQLGLQQQAVYDALMRAVMDAVRNLDLEYHQSQAGVDQEAVAKPTSPDSKELLKQACTANNIQAAACVAYLIEIEKAALTCFCLYV